MRNLICTASLFTVLLFISSNCGKESSPTPAVVKEYHEYRVKPQVTDAAIQAVDTTHYAYVDTRTALKGKLLVFIGGTGSKPKYYQLFCKAAATLGYHVINVQYLNSVTTQICKDQVDAECHTKFREEIVFGADQSMFVTVNASNSIVNRALKLLQYLHTKYPTDGWDQFYGSTGLVYSKFVVAGHSQGGGHAAYIALKNIVDRVIVFSSPNDYSDYYSKSATWCRGTFATPIDRFYGLMHKRDDIIDPDKQYAIWKDMKMLLAADTSSADKATFKNFKSLYTNFEPNPLAGPFGLYHNVPVIDGALPSSPSGDQLKLVWNYVLGG
jgi:hypothetical protein